MSPHSQPSVPQFCGSTNVTPGRSQHGHATNRGSLYPMPGVSRFSTMSAQDSSVAKPRQELAQSSIDNLSRSIVPPPIDNMMRTVASYRSPTRSQSMGPSMHSFVAPPLSSFAPPPVVPKVNLGSFVGPPPSASFVAAPPNTPAIGRNGITAPPLSCLSPDIPASASRFRSPSPDPSFLAPPLPYAMQVGSDRCFIASMPSMSMRSASPTASVVTTPAFPRGGPGRASPGPSYVAPPPMNGPSYVAPPPMNRPSYVAPPLRSQNSMNRATSVDRFSAGSDGVFSRQQVSPSSMYRSSTPTSSIFRVPCP